MGIPNLGLIAPGYLADIILVDGDPTRDVRCLQDRERITTVMKDGVYYKRPGIGALGTQQAAARRSVWEAA
jgi:imidazolonepropionase-like amidohydrolase